MSRKRAGHTLIEVFFALLLVTSIFFALATIFPVSLATLRKSQSSIVAENLCRQLVEMYTNLPLKLDSGMAAPVATAWTPASSLTGLIGNPTIVTYPSPPGIPAPDGWDGTTYTGIIIVDNLTTADPNCLQLTVQVVWNSGAQTGNQLAGTTTFAESSIQYTTCVYNVANPW